MSEPTSQDTERAQDFRKTLMERADGHEGRYPWFYGWVIVEAHIAATMAERKRNAAGGVPERKET